MKTLLDDANTWFVHAIIRTDHLDVIVAEGIRAEEPEEFNILGKNLGLAYTVQIEPRSRYFSIHFGEVLAWQGIHEQFTAWDEYEQRDTTGVIQELQRSRFLDHLRQYHGWMFEIKKDARCFRVHTEHEIIDVVATDVPVIKLWTQ